MCDFISFGNEITILFGGVDDRENGKDFQSENWRRIFMMRHTLFLDLNQCENKTRKPKMSNIPTVRQHFKGYWVTDIAGLFFMSSYL